MDDAPETFDSSFKGQQAEGGGGDRQQGEAEDAQGRGAHDDEEGPQGCAGGARRCPRVLRQAQAELRGRGRELRGARGTQGGRDPVAPGGAQDPLRRGYLKRFSVCWSGDALALIFSAPGYETLGM